MSLNKDTDDCIFGEGHTARAYDRILKVARTILDLDGDLDIEFLAPVHILLKKSLLSTRLILPIFVAKEKMYRASARQDGTFPKMKCSNPCGILGGRRRIGKRDKSERLLRPLRPLRPLRLQLKE